MAGAFDVALAESLDRFSRDQEDTAGLVKRLTFAGAQIVTVSEGDIGYVHVGLKGTIDAPLSPRSGRGDREIHLEEAPVVQRIFREFVQGPSPKATGKTLNAEGVPGLVA